MQLGKEDSSDYPCAMFTEGVAISLHQLSVVMDTPDKEIVIAGFDRNRRNWWTGSEKFQTQKLCFDLENDRIYAAGARDQNIYMPTELLLRAQADGVYFVARARRALRTRCTLHTQTILSSEESLMIWSRKSARNVAEGGD